MDSLRPSAAPLVQNRHYLLTAEPFQRILRLKRTSEPFVSAEDVNHACEPVQQALDAVGRARHSLLIDSRDAPFRNDPVYEAWFQPHRKRMTLGLRRVAVLLRTAAGKLHSERLVKTVDRSPANLAMFVDEEAALEFLRK